jgi:hypothetical protein
MPHRQQRKHGLFEVVLAGGSVAAMLVSLASESAFAMSILSVAILALAALLHDAWL